MNVIIKNFVLTIFKGRRRVSSAATLFEFPYQLELSDDSNVFWFVNEQYMFVEYGEITNLKELAQQNNIRFKSDLDIVTALFEKYGMGIFDKFRGRYACILVDKTKHCVYICKDYIGSKALYYYEDNDAVYITSHASNLQSMTRINREHIKKVLDGERIFGSESAFIGVKCVPVGSVMLLIEERSIYFHKLSYNIPLIRYKREDDYYEHFADLLLKTLNRISDSNVAFTVSGGLDCTLLTYLFSNTLGRDTKALTFDLSSYGKASEEKYLKDIEKNKKITIEYVNLKSRFLESIFSKTFDEPNYYILTNAWDIMLRRCEKKGITSIVTGFGGDEITVGYDYLKHKDVSKIGKKIYRSFHNGFSDLILDRRCICNDHINYTDVRIPPHLNSSYIRIYNRLFNGEIGRLIYRYEQDCFELNNVSLIAPFLERDIIDFSLGIPVDVHANKGMTKMIQRNVGHNLFPKSVEKRKDKSDFFYWYIIELQNQYDAIKSLIQNSIVLGEEYSAFDINEIFRQFYNGLNMSYLHRKELANKLLDFISVEVWLQNLKKGK